MVVVEENVLYHVKRKGELSERGKSPGEIYPRGKCPGGMSRSLTITRPIYSVQGYASQQAKLWCRNWTADNWDTFPGDIVTRDYS